MKTELEETVDTLMRHIDKSLSKEAGEAFKYHFLYIRSLLKQSIIPEGIDLEKAEDVMRYIEAIPLEKSGGIPWKAFGQLMAEHGEPILPKSTASWQFSRKQIPLSSDYHEELGNMHLTLRRALATEIQLTEIPPILQESANTGASSSSKTFLPAWTHTYPKNEKGEVMNQTIGEWQATQMTFPTNPKKSYGDFTRNYKIKGTLGKDEKEVDLLLADLVNSAAYNDNDKEKILAWLKANGGQANTRFFDGLLNRSEFNEQELMGYKPIATELDWTLTEDGKIAFHMGIRSWALQKTGEPEFLLNNEKQELIEETDLETILKISKDKSGIPLLDAQSTIQLELNEQGQVQPCIVELNVTSYSKGLVLSSQLAPDEDEDWRPTMR